MRDDRGPDFVIEISPDAADWRPVASAKGGRRTHEIALFEHAATASFPRRRVPAVTPEQLAQLSEVRVFAKPRR